MDPILNPVTGNRISLSDGVFSWGEKTYYKTGFFPILPLSENYYLMESKGDVKKKYPKKHGFFRGFPGSRGNFSVFIGFPVPWILHASDRFRFQYLFILYGHSLKSESEAVPLPIRCSKGDKVSRGCALSRPL
jgi:hypothetical protein